MEPEDIICRDCERSALEVGFSPNVDLDWPICDDCRCRAEDIERRIDERRDGAFL